MRDALRARIGVPGTARSPRLLRTSARSRGVTSVIEIPVHRVGGKTVPVTACEERDVAGRQAGGGGGDTRKKRLFR